MSENFVSKKVGTAAAAAGFALLLASSVGVAAEKEMGRLTSSSGVVLSGAGECWEAKDGSKELYEECGDVMPVADSDGDGVPDDVDACPGTPAGVAVDARGCPRDSDGDGVPDYLDKCPGTPSGAKVDADGCEIMDSVSISVTADHFDFDSATLKPAMESELSDVAAKVRASAGSEMLEVVGHTDSTGPEAYNQGLSERRAEAAASYLIDAGVPASQISTMGKGESEPVGDNGTREGRAMNRRVEVLTR